ncbi:MAG: phosphoserine transaminase [Alphaproteobacteria bacterium]|nr:phosphoserine transaminase [Alphaproteobacteria bacterium]
MPLQQQAAQTPSNTAKPTLRPKNPCFSSGPAAKRPGWTIDALKGALLGRSHRAKPCKERIAEAIDLSRKLLGLPDDYLIGIVPASNTGAVEMALWSMLGPRPVDVLAWDVFGATWLTDITKQLKLENVRTFKTEHGTLPDLAKVDCDHDVVFTWNGTTAGVCVPDAEWIPADRKGLTICDATSAVLAMDMDWSKLDVVTYSWQKVLGGEAAHGILILSPRAVERLESYKPAWPLPKLFRMTKDGKVNLGIFKGETINTISMLCIEDVIDALKWAHGIGGRPALMKRTAASCKAIEAWVAATPWIEYMCGDPRARSTTSVTLKFADPAITGQPVEAQWDFVKKLGALLDKEGVAHDINGHRDAPPGLRLWCGGTVDPDDVAALLPWIGWAYAQTLATLKAAA